MRTSVGLGVAFALIACFVFADNSKRSAPKSTLMSWDQAKSHVASWGEMRTYFTGNTYGTTNMFTAIAVVKPGESVHPSHRHAEEEFLVLTKGSGTWRLDGKEIPGKEGDVLYIEPWHWHGLVNTSKEPLTFFVVRWNNQGVPSPPAPAGDNGK